MPRLTRLLSLTRLTWLPWAALPVDEDDTDPLAGPPLEFATADGVLIQTADGVYFGVTTDA